MLLEETIRNGYFWSNLVALGLLWCLFVIIVYQHRVQTCREWTAAETLAQYEHALARANAQVEEATRSNRGLMDALTALRESALRSQAPPGETQDRPAPQTVSSLVPKDKLVSSGQGWAQDVTPTNIRLIGVVEVLGAAGLILPAVTHIAPFLVPLAAIGLVLVMVGAAVVHARRNEAMNIGVNAVLLALAAFVAWGRFGPYPLA